MKNIADIYVRLSDEDREKRYPTDESESIQNQKSMLVNYCLEQGWQINQILCDEDYSGVDRNRPAFNQLLKDCEEGKIDIVLCKTQSRFSRDMEIIEKYIHGKFIEWDIRFVSVVDHADTNVQGNKKARQINGLINEWYLEDLSENIKRTLYHKKIKGEYCCPYAPYGYKLDPEDKHHFIIDEPAAEIVRSIYEMYKSGMGYIRIAKSLNDRLIPPPSVYKEMQGLGYKNPYSENTSSKQWRDTTIYYILRHEVYTGAMVQGKSENISYKNKKRRKLPKSEWIIVPNMHEPIINEELWDAVQEILRNHRSRDKQFKVSNEQEINPLRGIVFCMECGSGMWRMSYQCAERRYKYYRCRTVKNSNGVCDNINSIRQKELEEHILEELKRIINEYYEPSMINLKKDHVFFDKIKTLNDEKKMIESKIEKCNNNLVNLYKDRNSGFISDEQFGVISKSFNKEIAEGEKRIKLILEEIPIAEADGKRHSTREEILDRYKNVDELSFELVSELIDSIYVGKADTKTKQRIIEIHWKF